MKLSLKNIISPSIPASFLLLSIGYLLWAANYFLQLNQMLDQMTSYMSNSFSFFNDIVLHVVSLGVTVLNSILIFQLNNRFTIIKTRTFLPVFIYNILIGSWLTTHQMVGAHFAATLILITLFLLFQTYRNRNASEQAFLIGLLIAFAGFIVKPLAFVLILSWIGLIRLNSFSLKTFFASIIGFTIPWIYYLLFQFYFQSDLLWIESIFSNYEWGFSITNLPIEHIIYIILLSVIFLLAQVGINLSLHSESVQTRAKLTYLSVLTIGLFIVSIFLLENYIELLPCLGIGYAILLSHPLTLKQVNFYGIIFYLFILLNLVFVGYQIYLSLWQ